MDPTSEDQAEVRKRKIRKSDREVPLKAYKEMLTMKKKVFYNVNGEPIHVKVQMNDHLIDGINVLRKRCALRQKSHPRISLQERQSLINYQKRTWKDHEIFFDPDISRTVELVRNLLLTCSSRYSKTLKSVRDTVESYFRYQFGETSVRDQNLKQFYNSLLINRKDSPLLRMMVRILNISEEDIISLEDERLYLTMRSWLINQQKIFTSHKGSSFQKWFVSKKILVQCFEASMSLISCVTPPSLSVAVNDFIESIHQKNFGLDNAVVDIEEALEGFVDICQEFDRISTLTAFNLFGNDSLTKLLSVPETFPSTYGEWPEQMRHNFLKIKSLLDMFILHERYRGGEISFQKFQELCQLWIGNDAQDDVISKYGLLFSGETGVLYFEFIAYLHLRSLKGDYNVFSVIEEDQYFENGTLQMISNYAKHVRYYNIAGRNSDEYSATRKILLNELANAYVPKTSFRIKKEPARITRSNVGDKMEFLVDSASVSGSDGTSTYESDDEMILSSSWEQNRNEIKTITSSYIRFPHISPTVTTTQLSSKSIPLKHYLDKRSFENFLTKDNKVLVLQRFRRLYESVPLRDKENLNSRNSNNVWQVTCKTSLPRVVHDFKSRKSVKGSVHAKKSMKRGRKVVAPYLKQNIHSDDLSYSSCDEERDSCKFNLVKKRIHDENVCAYAMADEVSTNDDLELSSNIKKLSFSSRNQGQGPFHSNPSNIHKGGCENVFPRTLTDEVLTDDDISSSNPPITEYDVNNSTQERYMTKSMTYDETIVQSTSMKPDSELSSKVTSIPFRLHEKLRDAHINTMSEKIRALYSEQIFDEKLGREQNTDSSCEMAPQMIRLDLPEICDTSKFNGRIPTEFSDSTIFPVLPFIDKGNISNQASNPRGECPNNINTNVNQRSSPMKDEIIPRLSKVKWQEHFAEAEHKLLSICSRKHLLHQQIVKHRPRDTFIKLHQTRSSTNLINYHQHLHLLNSMDLCKKNKCARDRCHSAHNISGEINTVRLRFMSSSSDLCSKRLSNPIPYRTRLW